MYQHSLVIRFLLMDEPEIIGRNNYPNQAVKGTTTNLYKSPLLCPKDIIVLEVQYKALLLSDSFSTHWDE